MNSRFGHAAAFGLVSAIAVIILSLGIYLMDMHNSALNWLSYPVLIAIACYGVKKWRDQSGGYLGYGQTYLHLFFQNLIYSAVMAIWTVVFMTVIAPGLMEDQMLIQRAKMEEQGMSAAEVEMAMEWAEKFSSPGVLAVFALFGGIIFMGLIHLIVAAIMKKDPPPFQNNDQQFQNFPPQA